MEWFNLASIHGPAKYYLHDDFYSDNGVAEQPKEEVEDPYNHLAPTLEIVEHDRERLLDYGMARYFLDNPTTAALSRHDREEILASLKWRVATSRNFDIESGALDICTEVIGEASAEWIRDRWSDWTPQTLYSLAKATAACLPTDEGFRRVAEVFEDKGMLARLQQGRFEVCSQCAAFAPFQSRKTLDWIEAHPSLVGLEKWGQLASQSHFSWLRAIEWLERGRPLSHMALYAIRDCFRHDDIERMKYRPFALEDPAPVETMMQKLQEYYEADPVPHVRNLVRRIGDLMAANNSRDS